MMKYRPRSNDCRLGALVLVAVLAVALTGCGGRGNKESITRPKPPLKLSSIVLTMEWDANRNWPVPVELVRVRDADLVDELLAIESKEWFSTKGNDFRNSNPSAYTHRWEIVPGTVIGPEKVKIKPRVAGVLFCGLNDETPPFRFRQNGKAIVVIDQAGCSVEKYSRARAKKIRRRSE